MPKPRVVLPLLLVLALSGCEDDETMSQTDSGMPSADSGMGSLDGGPIPDGGPRDAGFDAGPPDLDAGSPDAGFDAGAPTMIVCDTLAPLDSGGGRPTNRSSGIAMDQSGQHVVVAWEQETAGGLSAIYVAEYDFATAMWSSARLAYEHSSGSTNLFADVALDADGDITVSYRIGTYDLWTRTWNASSGMWEPAELAIAGISNSILPRVGYDRVLGEPLVAYAYFDGGVGQTISMSRRSSGVWTREVLIAGPPQSFSDFAMNDLGEGALTARVNSPTRIAVFPFHMGGVRRNAGVPEGVVITPAGTSPGAPTVAVSPNRPRAYVAFSDFVPGTHQMAAALIDTAAGTVGTVDYVITSTTNVGVPWLGANMDDAVLYSGSGDGVASEYDDTTMLWSDTMIAAGIGSRSPRVALTETGVVYAIWSGAGQGPIATRNSGPGTAFLAPTPIGPAVASSGVTGLAVDPASGDSLMIGLTTEAGTGNDDLVAGRCR